MSFPEQLFLWVVLPPLRELQSTYSKEVKNEGIAEKESIRALKTNNLYEQIKTNFISKLNGVISFIFLVLVWFVGVYGISTLVVYLTPNTFLCK